LLGFGSYFCYDNPAALQDHFKKDLNISTGTFTGKTAPSILSFI
jgi:hypothetical protein